MNLPRRVARDQEGVRDARMIPHPVAAIIGMGDTYASVKNRKDPLQLAVEATHREYELASSTVQ